MARTKAKELTPVTQLREDGSACPICNPNPKRVREDQVWGRCPTNRPHRPHSRGLAKSR